MRSNQNSSIPNTHASTIRDGDGALVIGDFTSIGPYRILRKLGHGGMSEVYLGFDPNANQTIAIKLLADHLAKNPSYVVRFRREVLMSKFLQHRHLVRGLSNGHDPKTGKYYLVLEYVDGPSAQTRLETEGRFSVGEAAKIVLDIARALEYLHSKKLIHRDVKPGNILIACDGTAKLADLGVAKSMDSSSELTAMEQGVGTPYYMPWEQTMNSSFVDERSDLFALGATFYHLVTGIVPFAGDTDVAIARLKEHGVFRPVLELDPDLPPILNTILNRMLAKNLEKRFRTASEFIEVLTASGLIANDQLISFDAPEEDLTLTATRTDIQTGEPTPIDSEAMWILRFRRSQGPVREIRARTKDIIKWYEAGQLPENTKASREPKRRFRPLRAYPEFQSLVALEPALSELEQSEPESNAHVINQIMLFLAIIGLFASAAFSYFWFLARG